MKSPSAPLLALLATATLAQAQTADQPMYVSGDLRFDYADTNGGDADLAQIDISLGLRMGAPGGNPLGFELGIKGYESAEFDLSDYALFPTLWVETGYGKFSVGAPRSALADRIETPRFGGSRIADPLLDGALNTTEALATLGDQSFYGLRYDGTFGDYDVGASWHHFDNNADTLTAVVARDLGAFDFALGVELIDAPGLNEENLLATLGYDAGQYGGRFTWGQSGIVGDTDGVALEGFYKPFDPLTLGASWGRIDAGSDPHILGVSAEMEFLTNGYAGVGYVDAEDADNAATAWVGWKLDY